MRTRNKNNRRKKITSILLAVLVIVGVVAVPIVSAINQSEQDRAVVQTEAQLTEEPSPDAAPEDEGVDTQDGAAPDEPSTKPEDTDSSGTPSSTDDEGGANKPEDAADEQEHHADAVNPDADLPNEEDTGGEGAGRVYLDAYLVNREGQPIKIAKTPDEHGRYVQEVPFEQRTILENDRLNKGRENYQAGEEYTLDPEDILEIDQVKYQYLDKKDGANWSDSTEETYVYPEQTAEVRSNMAYMRRVNVRLFVIYPEKEQAELLYEIPDSQAAYAGDVLDMNNYPAAELANKLPEGTTINHWTTDLNSEDAPKVDVDGSFELRDQDVDLYLDYDYDYATVTYKYVLAGYETNDSSGYYNVFPADIEGNRMDPEDPSTWIYLHEGEGKLHEKNGNTKLLPGEQVTLDQYNEKVTNHLGGIDRISAPFSNRSKEDGFPIPEDGTKKDQTITLKSGDNITVYVPYTSEYNYSVRANYPEDVEDDVAAQEDLLWEQIMTTHSGRLSSIQIKNKVMPILRRRIQPSGYAPAGFYVGSALDPQTPEQLTALDEDPCFFNFGQYGEGPGMPTFVNYMLGEGALKDNNIYVVWGTAKLAAEDLPKFTAYFVDNDGQALDTKGEIINPQPTAPIDAKDVTILGERNFTLFSMQHGISNADSMFIVPGVVYNFSVHRFPVSFDHPVLGTRASFQASYPSRDYHENSTEITATLDTEGNIYLVDKDTGEVAEKPLTKSELLYGFKGPQIIHFNRNLSADDDVEYTMQNSQRGHYVYQGAPFGSKQFSKESLGGKVFSHWTSSSDPTPEHALDENLPAEKKRFYLRNTLHGMGSAETDNERYLHFINTGYNYFMHPIPREADNVHFYAWYADDYAYFSVQNVLVNNKGVPIDASTGRPLSVGDDFINHKYVIGDYSSKPIEVPGGRPTPLKSITRPDINKVHEAFVEDEYGKYMPSLAYEGEDVWGSTYRIPWLAENGTPILQDVATKRGLDNPEILYLGYQRNVAVTAHPNYPVGNIGQPTEATISVGSPYEESLSKDGLTLRTSVRDLEMPTVGGYRFAGWSLDVNDKENLILAASDGAYIPNIAEGATLYGQWVKVDGDAYTGRVSMHSHLVNLDGEPLGDTGEIGPMTVQDAKVLRDAQNITIDIPAPGNENLNVNYFLYYPRARNFTSEDGTLRYRFEPKSTQYGGHENIKAVMLTPDKQKQEVHFGYAALKAHELSYELNIPDNISMPKQEVEDYFYVDNTKFYAGERVTPELAIFDDAVTDESNYAFMGWTENPDGTGAVYKRDGANEFVMPEGGATLYAKWHYREDVFVRYLARDNGQLSLDGEVAQEKTVYYPYNTPIDEMDIPTPVPNENYVFNRYYTPTSWDWKWEDIGSDGLPKPGTRITSDQRIELLFMKRPEVTITFRVKWSDMSKGYFDTSEGKKDYISQTVYKDAPFNEILVPTPVAEEGHYFDGWEPALPSDDEKIEYGRTYYAGFTKKTDITLVTGQAQKEYDGTPLVEHSYTISPYYALKPGHKIDTHALVFPNSVTHVNEGAVPNTLQKDSISVYEETALGERIDRTYQYNIKDPLTGELKITPRKVAIVAESFSIMEGETPATDRFTIEPTDVLVAPDDLGNIEVRVGDESERVPGTKADVLYTVPLYVEVENRTNSNYAIETVAGELTVLKKPVEIENYVLSYSANIPADATQYSSAVHAALQPKSATYRAGAQVGNFANFATLPSGYPYVFAGWAQHADGSSRVGASFTMPAANTTLYAVWNRAADYTVTVKPGEGGGLNGSKDNIIIPLQPDEKWSDDKLPTPTPDDGYYFDHWEGKPETGKPVDGDREVTAVFKKQTQLTITTQSARKDYDGTPLRNPNYTTSGQLKEGDQLVVQVTGAVQNVSSVHSGNNTFAYKIVRGARDVSYQYHVTEKMGTLTVDPIQATLQVQDATKTQGTADPQFVYTNRPSPIRGSGFIIKDPVRAAADKNNEAPGFVTLIPVYENAQKNYRVTARNGQLEIVASGGVAPTDPPVTPTNPPVTPTNPPVTPTNPPVTPTNPPVTPTNPPVTPTNPPVTPTNPPVTPTPDQPGGGGMVDPGGPDGGTGGGGTPEIVQPDGGDNVAESVERAEPRTQLGRAYQNFFDSPAPTLQIGDGEIPLYGRNGNVWALMNLLLAIAGVVLAIVLAAAYFVRRKEERVEDEARDVQVPHDLGEGVDEPNHKKKNLVWRLLAGAVAILAVVVFILTENMRLTMSLIDEWTLLMGVLLGVEIVFAALSSLKKQPTEDQMDEEKKLHTTRHHA